MCMGLFTILSFAMRLTSITWNFGLVRAFLPIIEQQFEDPSTKPINYPNRKIINSSTITIILNDHAFYFGELNAFSINYHEIRNKFTIPHFDGAPQIQNLINSIEKWQKENKKEKQTGILFVSPDWPVAIVIQIIHYLNQSDLFEQIILGGGYI